MNVENNILDLTEIFASIQGESSFVGLPTTFIRCSGCNLKCRWCDTTYSHSKGSLYSIEEIISKVQEHNCKNVCITGGEPLLQENIYDLIKSICDLEYVVSIETNGSLPIEKIDRRAHIIMDVKCPSSGMEKNNNWDNLSILTIKDEIKFVLADKNDYIYARDICQKFQLEQKVKNILLSPAHALLNPQTLASWIIEHSLRARLNLQIHKYIWAANFRGV